MDFAKLNAERRQAMRDSADPAQRRRAQILDRMDETQAEVEAMDDATFMYKLFYYRENSCTPEYMHNYPVGRRGECMTYDTVLHHIMLPELMKRLPGLIPDHVFKHHFLCEPTRCNHRCLYDKKQEIPF